MGNREETVSLNMGLVRACAMRFRGRGIEYEDLCQAGSIGLIKAADKFDPSFGCRFSTYAVPVIMGELRRLFRDGGSIKVSRSLKELGMRISRETVQFSCERGREPTIAELAEKLGETPEAVTEAMNACSTPLSLTITDEDGDGTRDIPTEAPELLLTELLSLRQELKKLPADDMELLRLRYFCRKTQTETAKALGMTQVQVSRREKKLLSELKRKLS